jgi:pimeloyl-ACP methyl ester carboxylesterase
LLRTVPLLVALASAAATSTARPATTDAPPTAIDGWIRSGSQSRVVTFRAGPGEEVNAAVLGTGANGVVLANQSDRDLCSWRPFAQSLRKAGYRVLLFDYGSAAPWLEVAAASRAPQRLGAARVALVGASEGAKASIVAAARPTTKASAVVSISAERYLAGSDVRPFAAKLRRPILFLTAKRDPFAASDTPLLYRACGSPDKKLVTLAGEAHGVDLLAGVTAPRARRAILAFLRRHG